MPLVKPANRQHVFLVQQAISLPLLVLHNVMPVHPGHFRLLQDCLHVRSVLVGVTAILLVLPLMQHVLAVQQARIRL